MDDQRDEAPELDLTSLADEAGEDALQLTPSDSMLGIEFGEAFAVGEKPAGEPAAAAAPTTPSSTTPSPAAPKKTSESLKPSKSSERLGDQQFVAALLGQPMPVAKKKRAAVEAPKEAPKAEEPKAVEVKPAVEAAAEAVVPQADPVVPVASLPEAPAEIAAGDLLTTVGVDADLQPTEAPVLAAETAVAEVVPVEVLPVEIAKSEAPAEASKEASIEPTLEQTPWDAVHAPALPKTRPLPPAGPMVATAPITTIEPELMPTPSAERGVAAAVPVAPAVSNAAASTADLSPAPPPVIPAAPIAMLSGVIISTPAPAPEAIAHVVAATPSVKPAVKPAAKPKFEPEPEPKAEPKSESKPAPAPVANVALSRDFAIPKPSLPPKPKAAPSGPPSKLPQPAARIELKPQKLAAEVVPVIEDPLPRTGAWWTLPMMFAGLIIIACALIVPVADENHRAAYELAKIERDVAHFQQQADVNASFLSRVSSDPALAERLAMRQLNMIRPDEKLAPLAARKDQFSMSPFALVNVDPPAPMPAYRPISGFLSRWFLDPKWQTYAVGIGLLMTAAGVVFGGGGEKRDEETDSEIAEPVAA